MYLCVKTTVIKIMRFIKQQLSLPIDNIDVISVRETYKKHGPLLPNTIRGIIAGPSNCGKTNVILSMLTQPNGLKFENIYIYSKSLYQPKYEYLKRVLSPIDGIGYYTFSNNSDVCPVEEAKPNSVFIFDDVACGKQDNIRSYFCMGRHKDIDSFYLCQTYSRIPKHLIRDNANLLILFKQDDMNLKHVYNDHVNTDMSFNEFRNMCSKCWSEKYGFITVDKDSSQNNGRYRQNFDTFIDYKKQ